MYLKALHLMQYRNYKSIDLEMSPGINVLLGENAQGKTNLIEAIYTLAMTKSHRTNNDKELISWGNDAAYISGELVRRQGKIPLSLQFISKGKVAKINHLEQSRLSHYIGQMNVILFAPEDLALVKGSPLARRQFIDRELGQLNPLYLHHSVTYKSLLKQRNAYLKQLNRKVATDRLYLTVLTEQLVKSASHILFMRYHFLKKLEDFGEPIHYKISDQKESLALRYVSGITITDEDTISTLYDKLLEKLKQHEKHDIERETTNYGPHRDDFSCIVNAIDIQKFGSQGQQRTTVLSLKLAEIELAYDATGEYPVLLLDDVLSELDDMRQTLLLKTIENRVQTFLTTTSITGIKKQLIVKPTIFTVSNGRIINGVCDIE
ncbi:MAG: DNA replication/repair protein RecF [Bavariicoccus seileri]|uniref:DNA replication/repair protein RecF n=1 Tax=Bavariicoccus seileri TaxID=549685 RepID=UPI003F94C485